LKSEKVYVNFYAPKELVEQFDRAIKGKYDNRTGAMLDLMRHFIEQGNFVTCPNCGTVIYKEKREEGSA